jgi:hypothetical protein
MVYSCVGNEAGDEVGDEILLVNNAEQLET